MVSTEFMLIMQRLFKYNGTTSFTTWRVHLQGGRVSWVKQKQAKPGVRVYYAYDQIVTHYTSSIHIQNSVRKSKINFVNWKKFCKIKNFFK